jgi:hypothetical protein
LEIDIEGLPSGLYFCRLATAQGARAACRVMLLR